MRRYILAALAVIVCWQVVSWLRIINPVFLPSPSETFREGVLLIGKRTILFDVLYSMQRVLSGFLLALLIGVPVGLLLGCYAKLYSYAECLLDFFRSVPPIITFPLALLIFGVGEASRVAVIVFGCTTIIMLNTALGIRNSSRMRINAAKAMGASWHQVFFRVMLFDALPQIFVGMRVCLSMAVIIAIVTEMLVGAKYGLGSRAVYAQISYNTPELYVTIIFVGMIGFIINKGLVLLEDGLIHWRNQG